MTDVISIIALFLASVYQKIKWKVRKSEHSNVSHFISFINFLFNSYSNILNL